MSKTITKQGKWLDKYLSMLNKLAELRLLHNNIESDEEDRLLDKMDKFWLKLSDQERDQIQKLPTKSVL